MTKNPATRHFKERAKIGLALSEPTEIRQALFNHDNARANRKRVNIITRQLPALDGRRNLARNDTTPSRSKMTNIPISTNRKPINVIYLKKFFIHFHTLLISNHPSVKASQLVFQYCPPSIPIAIREATTQNPIPQPFEPNPSTQPIQRNHSDNRNHLEVTLDAQ